MNHEPKTHIDLFSGIGGFALAARWVGLKTVVFCEQDRYCQRVLEKNFPSTPIVADIHAFNGRQWRGAYLLSGGFPCQPFSVAGKRRGAADDRALWPAMLKVISDARPRWVLGENVAGIVAMELDRVLSDLESIGYTSWPIVIPACAVDAKHRRDRVWILAHAIDGRSQKRWPKSRTRVGKGVSKRKKAGEHISTATESGEDVAVAPGDDGGCGRREDGPEQNGYQSSNGGSVVADSDESGCEERRWIESVSAEHGSAECGGQNGAHAADVRGVEVVGDEPNGNMQRGWCEWFPEPDVGRVAHGVPKRVDRLKGLGNAIVPQVAAEIIKAMLKADEEFETANGR